MLPQELRDIIVWRSHLTLATATLAAPPVVRAQAAAVIKFIPQSDVTAPDPVWTSVYVTRKRFSLLLDTLDDQDEQSRPQAQIVEGATTEQDGLLWRLTLRDQLRFHDDTPSLSRNCVASIKRGTT